VNRSQAETPIERNFRVAEGIRCGGYELSISSRFRGPLESARSSELFAIKSEIAAQVRQRSATTKKSQAELLQVCTISLTQVSVDDTLKPAMSK
jgi:hypothetical protein